MISPAYLEQNRLLHASHDEYGSNSAKWAKQVVALAAVLRTKNILDYGCGKGSLVKALQEAQFDAYGYDPAIPEYSAAPQPAQLVVCTDVLEHIEPEYVDSVLDELHRLTVGALYVIVCTREAKKILPDGRNAHLSVRHSNEWLQDLMKRFKLTRFNDLGTSFAAVLVK